MDHFRSIYTSSAAAYHRMIAAEDADGNLLQTIEALSPLSGQRILDLGTGTGRLPLLFADRPELLVGLDLHRAMLEENAAQRESAGGRWGLVHADLRRLPFPAASFSLATAGWVMGHFCGWYPERWREEIAAALAEIHRVVQTGGVIAIMETLSTGSLSPAPPTEGLAQYYSMLQGSWGFTRREIRTDYVFASVEAAAENTEFFFGPELAERIRTWGWARLPEWTGIWSITV